MSNAQQLSADFRNQFDLMQSHQSHPERRNGLFHSVNQRRIGSRRSIWLGGHEPCDHFADGGLRGSRPGLVSVRCRAFPDDAQRTAEAGSLEPPPEFPRPFDNRETARLPDVPEKRRATSPRARNTSALSPRTTSDHLAAVRLRRTISSMGVPASASRRMIAPGASRRRNPSCWRRSAEVKTLRGAAPMALRSRGVERLFLGPDQSR